MKAEYDTDGTKWSEELRVFKVTIYDLGMDKNRKALFLAETLKEAISFAESYYETGDEGDMSRNYYIVGCQELGDVIFPASKDK